MSSSPISFSKFPGTNYQTFSITKDPEKQGDSNILIVYLSKLENDGKNLVLKPLDPTNTESVNRAEMIASKKLLAGIEFRANGIFFRVHEDLRELIPEGGTSLSLNYGGEKINLGDVTCAVWLQDRHYSALMTFQKEYLDRIMAAQKKLSVR